MIIYSVYINNTLQSTIQASSRQQAVAMAHSEWKCAGIHVSVPSQWGER